MKLLFIQGGSRVRESDTGNKYVDGNFNNNIWRRYKSYCTNLTVILRKINKVFYEEDLNQKFNLIDTKILNLKLVSDVYSPKKNFFNIAEKNKIKKVIKEEVRNADKIIIRSIGNFYTNTALKYCKEFKKDYLIEVTGFAFEGLWYHSLYGKILAIPREIKLKKSIRNSPYTTYVTEKALQKRYPCLGKQLGCSDVEIFDSSNINLESRLNKISNYNDNSPLVIGTAAFLDVKWKGQQDVIKALNMIKKMNVNRKIEYQLIGSGKGDYLRKLIKKYNLEEDVKILGVKKHEDVFNWLNSIDVYVQPSYQEGLCRAIVEAMSCACPCIVSNAGGNEELINSKNVFKKGKVSVIVNKIINFTNKEVLMENAIDNFEKSKKYNKELLDERRDKFYKEFMNNNKNKE